MGGIKIKKWRDSVKEAVKEISLYQMGEKKPLITCFDHFNENALGGVMPGDVITIAGLSGHGKTYFLQEVEESILNLNECENVAFLRFNLEMSVQKLFMRSVKQTTKRKMSDILLKQPEGEFREQYKEIYEKHRSRRDLFHIEDPTSPEDFYENCKYFLDTEGMGKDKFCLITLDHIALIEGKDNKEAIDETIRYINKLKMEYKNVTFIILTQLNRNIENRTNPAELAPRASDIYQSSTMMFVSDIVIVVHNPYLLGHKKYLVLSRDDHDYLEEFFTTEGDSKWVNLETQGMLYYHYVKLRTPDSEETKTIFGKRIIPKRLNNSTIQTKLHDF